MRVSIDAPLARGSALEIDVRPGTSVRELLAEVGSSGAAAWCGAVPLSPDHAAGTYPLLHGARLSASRGEPCVEPQGPHLAVIAGPDAGGVIALDGPQTVGRAASAGAIDDPAMSRAHARAHADRDGIVVRDVGSANGLLAPDGATRAQHAVAREVRLTAGEMVRIGDSWLTARGIMDAASGEAIHQRHEGGGRRASIMVGAGISAVMLATITGRWYLALLAVVYPAATLVPTLLARLRTPAASILGALPDPTRATSAPAHVGVAICGTEPARSALARAEILARGRRPPAHPETLDEPWLEWLPAAQPGDGPLVLAAEPPSWTARTLTVSPSGIEVVADGRRELIAASLGVTPDRAQAAARRIAAADNRAQLPREVRWADLEPHGKADSGLRRLAAPLGLVVGSTGLPTTWALDLDLHGPHVLVAGTTGSGKSALLETLILSLCEAWGPQDLSLALFDFKGGAGLGRCAQVPHVAGVVTDLDGRHARRALTALGAELAQRKAQLAAHGYASFGEWETAGGAPARLLVVVDEFQEIGAAHRDFLPELTRLAAQGRSLGMHLILATQRPSGAVTPDIRANTSITIALRVASEAESRDLVGTSEAAAIPPDVPGRAIVAWGSSRHEIHIATPSASPTPAVQIRGHGSAQEQRHLLDVVTERHQHARRNDALWHEPLPADIEVEDLDVSTPNRATLDDGASIPMGLADRASSRLRDILAWHPTRGPLAVLGPPSRDRNAALECAAAGAREAGFTPVWLPADPRTAARTLALSHERSGVMLLVEDLTRALAALSLVDRGAAAEALVARAAGGEALAFGLGAGSPHRIAAHASLRLVLTGTSSQEDALWSIPRELQGIAPEPRLVRAFDAHGWCEARIANAPALATEDLALALPTHVARAQLASPHGIGIGGDDAREIVLEAGSIVTVVGAPGRERDHAVRTLEFAGAQAVECFDAPVLMPARARDGIVVATEPTPRVAEDLCRGVAAGLVEPTFQSGRVLWVDSGRGACVQLVSPAPASAPVALP